MGINEIDGTLEGWFDGEEDLSSSKSLCAGSNKTDVRISDYPGFNDL